MKQLKLEVLLGAVDRLTAPLKNVQKQMSRLQQQTQHTTARLNQLKQQTSTANAFKQLQGELAQTNQKMQAARDKAKQLADQLRATANPTAKLRKQVTAAHQAAHRLALAQAQQRQSLRQGGFDTAKFGQSQEKLKRKLNETTAAVNKQNAAMQRLQRRQAQQTAYRESVDRLKDRSERLKNFGQRSMIAGTVGTAVAGAMLKPAVEFEQAFSKVQALTRLDKVKDANKIHALRNQAIHLGATTAFTSSQVAEGQGYLAMAGFNDKQILASMQGILNMSQASGTELARVSDIASDISSGFKIPAEQMGRVADVLTLTFTTSNTSLETLYETMKEGGPIMTSLGQSFESSAAMAGLLGNVGIKGSSAGTALKNIGLNMIDNKHLKKLGVQVKDTKGNMRQIPQILADIKKKTDRMGTAQRSAVIKSIFGKIPVAAAMELISQADGALQNYEKMIENAAGTVQNVSHTMTDNLLGDLKSLESAKEALGISIYDTVSADLRNLTQSFTDLLRRADSWIKANPRLTAQLVKWGAALAGGITLLGAFSLEMSFVFYPIGRTLLLLNKWTGVGQLFNTILRGGASGAALAGKGLMSYQGTLKGLNTVVSVVAGGLRKFPTALLGILAKFKQLSFWLNGFKTLMRVALSPLRLIFVGIGSAISFLLSPIGLVVAALVGAGVLIYKHWDKVRSFFGGFWEGLKNGLAPVIEKFKPLGDLFGVVVGWIEKAVQWFTDLLQPVQSTQEGLDSAAKAGKKFGEWLAAGIDLVTMPLQWVMDSIEWVKNNLPTLEKASEKAMTVNNAVGNSYMAGLGYDPTGSEENKKMPLPKVPTTPKWSGGYAGNGGKYEPKGIYHGGEYIMTKAATARLGVPLLNALNYGKKAALAAGVGASLGVQVSAAPIQLDPRPPLAPRHSSVHAAAPMQVQITINAAQGQNERQIAQLVAQEVAKVQQRQQIQQRSRLWDSD